MSDARVSSNKTEMAVMHWCFEQNVSMHTRTVLTCVYVLIKDKQEVLPYAR